LVTEISSDREKQHNLSVVIFLFSLCSVLPKIIIGFVSLCSLLPDIFMLCNEILEFVFYKEKI